MRETFRFQKFGDFELSGVIMIKKLNVFIKQNEIKWLLGIISSRHTSNHSAAH